MITLPTMAFILGLAVAACLCAIIGAGALHHAAATRRSAPGLCGMAFMAASVWLGMAASHMWKYAP